MEIYLVGGAVRDRLLGLPVVDRDYVVVGSTPEEMVARGFKPVGADFPVFLHPTTKEEYALARTERKQGRGYKGFTVYSAPDVRLEDDLQRRDLTVNAMAEDSSGRLIDPFGGAADLEAGILRHVSPAFVEDPLRVLRVARFAARFADRGFRVADETLALMRRISESGELDHLVPERVWQELERALAESRPAQFFTVLRDGGALARLFPEIEALYGVPQPPQHHPEIDTGVHVMLVIDQAAALTDDTRIRFAALLHDLGKATTPADILPRHHGHEERGTHLIVDFCQRFRVPNDYRDLAVLVARHHGKCHRFAELRPGTVLELLEALDAFRRPERVDQFATACEADARGRTGLENRPYPQRALLAQAFAAAQAVDTAAVAAEALSLGLAGPAIGERIRERRIGAIKAAISPRPE
ncbi:MAG: multifunctional CCA addition/repair protein [Gammaproteobacteria bacterium]|nr:multifunctional CCA addition/repair protein [Gammaproteobacteria bacterium]